MRERDEIVHCLLFSSEADQKPTARRVSPVVSERPLSGPRAYLEGGVEKGAVAP